MCVQDWPVEAACALGFCAWRAGENPEYTTVGEVEQFFAKACFDADQILGEAAACRWFLTWFDDTPRDEMRAELAEEVRRAILERPQLSELVTTVLVELDDDTLAATMPTTERLSHGQVEALKLEAAELLNREQRRQQLDRLLTEQ
jgi:hypothetical protein